MLIQKLPMKKFLALWAILWLCATGNRLHAQGINTEFGKNILQHKDFDWYYFQTENFDIYYYLNGKELAQYTLVQGGKFLKEIETKIDYPLGQKITFVVYNSYSDYRQSNSRLNSDDDINPGG